MTASGWILVSLSLAILSAVILFWVALVSIVRLINRERQVVFQAELINSQAKEIESLNNDLEAYRQSLIEADLEHDRMVARMLEYNANVMVEKSDLRHELDSCKAMVRNLERQLADANKLAPRKETVKE